MSVLNSTEPLGLPTGSVRAIIALMIIAATLIVYITTAVLPEGLSVLASVVTTWYFVNRDNAPLPPVIEPLAEPLA